MPNTQNKVQAFTRLSREDKAKLTALSYYRRIHEDAPSSETAIIEAAVLEYLDKYQCEWSQVFKENPMDLG